LRTEGTVFVVKAIARAIGRGHVKFHEVNVLSQNIGGSTHLEVVNQIIVWHQIRVPILDDVSSVTTEEQRLRRTASAVPHWAERESRLHIFPQRENALLRIVPTLLIKRDVQLNRCGFVGSFESDRVTRIVNRRIGKWRSRLWPQRQTIQDEAKRS